MTDSPLTHTTARWDASWQAVLPPFVWSRLAIFVTGVLAIILGPMQPGGWQLSSQPWLDLWSRWDSAFYLSIAADGYSYTPGEMSNVAFFPLYPLLLRLLSFGTQNWLLLSLLGALLSHAFTLVAFSLLYRLVRLDHDRATARRAVWYLAFFPTSFFLSVVYTEALFLLLTLAAFYWARRQHWPSAALAAGLSAATRFVGVFLLLPLAYEWLRQRASWLEFFYLLLVPSGLLAFVLYLQLEFGDPLLFVEAAGVWGRKFILFGWEERLQGLLTNPDFSSWARRALVDLAFVGGSLLLFLLSLRYMRPSYALYVAYSLGVPLSTLQLDSIPRYLLVAFPIFILLARYFKGRLFPALIAASALLQVVFVIRWSLWFWVA